MIFFNLKCGDGHVFEAGFRSSHDFDAQNQASLIACPCCGNSEIDKDIQKTGIALGASRPQSDYIEAEKEKILSVCKEIYNACEDVGERFTEKARAMHYGETDKKGIRGTATRREALQLMEENINIFYLPPIKENFN